MVLQIIFGAILILVSLPGVAVHTASLIERVGYTRQGAGSATADGLCLLAWVFVHYSAQRAIGAGDNAMYAVLAAVGYGLCRGGMGVMASVMRSMLENQKPANVDKYAVVGFAFRVCSFFMAYWWARLTLRLF